ncbi:ATP-binding protein [Comamonas sp.]|uniref:ATP-binding protein n=1 Tax=Comamonas sp. TaxID=34028 RepID=UPI0028A1787C|nr:ATP-binding protein [Comamonas sp.]
MSFAVSDTGIGIDLDRGIGIFGAFQQMQEENGSTGLGLFIAQRILSAMGGSLSVTSTAGAGTTFSFSFLAPVIEGPSAEWPVLARTPMQPATQTGDAAPTPNALPADQALEELAHLALHGRLTDIERWIEVQSASGDSAPSSLRSAICWNGLIFLPSSS